MRSLPVQACRQPNAVACLPTAVWVVLSDRGHAVSYDEIAEACEMDARGAVQEIALQGLREAGFDVDLLEEWDADAVRSALENDQPVIASIPLSALFAHAWSCVATMTTSSRRWTPIAASSSASRAESLRSW